MTPEQFENVKKQALDKWSISFTCKGLAQEWWDFTGRKGCSFCKAFTVEESIDGMWKTYCGQCPLRDLAYPSCCKEWHTIGTNYSSVDFLDVINEQVRLLYLRIEALQYNTEWETIKKE